MKILHSRTHCHPLEAESYTKQIPIKLTDENGPELTLSDGSKICFSDNRQYYKVGMDPKSGIAKNADLDLEYFKKYFKWIDDIRCYYGNDTIREVELYYIDERPVYRLLVVQ